MSPCGWLTTPLVGKMVHLGYSISHMWLLSSQEKNIIQVFERKKNSTKNTVYIMLKLRITQNYIIY